MSIRFFKQTGSQLVILACWRLPHVCFENFSILASFSPAPEWVNVSRGGGVCIIGVARTCSTANYRNIFFFLAEMCTKCRHSLVAKIQIVRKAARKCLSSKASLKALYRYPSRDTLYIFWGAGMWWATCSCFLLKLIKNLTFSVQNLLEVALIAPYYTVPKISPLKILAVVAFTMCTLSQKTVRIKSDICLVSIILKPDIYRCIPPAGTVYRLLCDLLEQCT